MEKNEVVSLWVQSGAVLVALAASVIALIVSALDRRNSRQIAAKDRQAALEREQLIYEQEALLRLLQNLRRGGHTDQSVIQDMGAEAGALIGVIGQDRLPRNWEKKIGKTDEELLAYVDNEEKPEWQRRTVEAQIALNEVTREIRDRIAKGDGV